MVLIIQAILSAILLLISSLFSGAGSSELAGSSNTAEAGSSQRNIVTGVPAGLETANAQQMEFVVNSEWQSAKQPDSFRVNFRIGSCSSPAISSVSTLRATEMVS